MKKNIMIYLVMILSLFLLGSSLANAEVKFKGLVQTWFSYADQDGSDDSGYGFTLRRVRFAPNGSLSNKVKWGIQVYWDKQSLGILDAFLDFRFSKQFGLKVGQFTAPGSVSGSTTSSSKLDFVERAMISQKWGGNSALKGYRGTGVQAYGTLASGKFFWALMLANPKTTNLFNPGLGSSTYAHDRNGISLWARAEARPVKGLRIGAFYGSSEDDNDFVTNSYGAHFFHKKGSLNLKLEYIRGKYGPKTGEIKYNGFYALLGYRIKKIEPIIRYDSYQPNDGNPDGDGVEKYNNISIGLNYYYDKKIKFQANYVNRDESMFAGLEKLANNIFYVCFQYTYN